MPTMSRTRTRDPAAGAHDSVIGPVSDGDKAGATLLFSGIFLSLVGVTFTAMVWIDFPARFEWTQLLGPILLSVGGTFALISVCKFRIVSCLPPPGPPSVLGDIDQPVRLPRAAVARCLPPPCASVTHDVSAPPQHYGRWTGDQALECVCPPAYADLFPD
ncbi:transmembrane protein 174 [Denticeps clupeoides]|nr:transmembrane protein 174 [Denticeps clupeoides]